MLRNRLGGMAFGSILMLSLVMAFAGPPPVFGNLASVEVCHGDCICIGWNNGVEVRCPDFGSGSGGGGWTQTPPPTGPMPDNNGTFNGNGQIPPASNAPPADAIPPAPSPNGPRLANAKDAARTKLQLKCHKDPITQQRKCWETTCTMLFANNPTHQPGRNLEGSAIYRMGQNYSILRNGQPYFPCQDPQFPTLAFRDPARGPHDRYVFLCNNFFTLADPADSGLILLHEILHFAGQNEDLTPLVGVGNPPTTGQISDAVLDACTAPQEVGDGYAQ
jgi:hypothetical protein